MNKSNKKGFTLVELLIVIGILAILAAVVVIVLNPAQLLAQARDSQRISDLDSLRSALAFYLSTVSSPALGTDQTCYVFSETLASVDATCAGGTGGLANAHASNTTAGAVSSSRNTDGTGWVPVDFSDIPGGTPLPILPVDPVNNASSTDVSPAGLFYVYAPDNTNKTFELSANLESVRFTSGSDNKEANDGGSTHQLYEVGTDPDLDL